MKKEEYNKLLECVDFVCLRCTELSEETCESCPVRKTMGKIGQENMSKCEFCNGNYDYSKRHIDSAYWEDFKPNFCPMCGRKIVEVSNLREIAECIVEILEDRGFNDITDSSGYFTIKEFNDDSDRAIDVYKSDGEGTEKPHYVIYCSYEDDTSDYFYSENLTAEALLKVIDDINNT